MGSGCKFCIGGMNVNCVGVDVSKGKSMVAVMRPLGEMVIPPFEVGHTDAELCELSRLLRELDGNTRVVMEATGNYHMPVASFLYDSGFYVSVVNAMLIHGYGNNSLRRAKTDKKDAIKLASYGLDHWPTLPKYIPKDEVRFMLKTTYRQYCQRQFKIVRKRRRKFVVFRGGQNQLFPCWKRVFTICCFWRINSLRSSRR